GRGFDPFDPRLLSIKLDVVLSLNGLEVRTLSHCIIAYSSCCWTVVCVVETKKKRQTVANNLG
ncbi:hypothetical protein SFRURICE_013401, partial [Spodoptera frugiperda]